MKICSFLSCLLDALGVGSLKQGTFQQLVMLLVCQHPENSRRRLAVLWPRYTHNCREKRSGDTCGVTCALGYYFASWGSQFLCNGTFQGSLDCILLTLPCFGSFWKAEMKETENMCTQLNTFNLGVHDQHIEIFLVFPVHNPTYLEK